MGFGVSTQAGDERAAERALQRSDLAAVVFVPEEEEGVRAWVRDDAGEEPAELELDVEGSRDTFALRTAELLRGRLMPGPSPRGGSADDEGGATSASRFSISLGPSVIASSYAAALIGLTGDVSWSITERLALGPYLLVSLERGALVLVDYGYVRRDYYHPERDGGTLICHYRHRAHADPFLYPGLQDISAWVDFSACADAARAAKLDIGGFTTQAQFLIGALGDLTVRVVEQSAWDLVIDSAQVAESGVRLAPRGAVALDLTASGDPRHWIAAQHLLDGDG